MSKEYSANAFQEIISHCKEYGFIFPSSEIYDGLGAVYDYGPYGVELKKNIQEYWWRSMVQMHENIVGIDAAIFMHPKTWKASGHVDAFSDPPFIATRNTFEAKTSARPDNVIFIKKELNACSELSYCVTRLV